MRHYKAPAVSIVLPYCNEAGTLPKAIRSVLQQTFFDFELLLIDSASSDPGPRIAAQFAAADYRIRLLAEQEGGLVAALNHGIAEARAGLIARMDADDWMHPERLAQQVRYLREHPEIGAVGAQVKFAARPGSAEGYGYYVAWTNQLTEPGLISLRRFQESPFAHPSMLFRKSLIDEHGGYSQGDFPEDYELWLRWLDSGVRMGKLPQPLLTWYDRPGRLSREASQYRTEAFFKLKAFYLARWLARCNPVHPGILVWGAGKRSRYYSSFLEAHGIHIQGYIDLKRRYADGKPCYLPREITGPGKVFIVSYVNNRGMGAEVFAFLERKGFREGKDFMLAAGI